MTKSIFKFMGALGILLVALTLSACERDNTPVLSTQVMYKVSDAFYDATESAVKEQGKLLDEERKMAEPEPTPEPMPPITELCMRMQWFDEVALVPGEKISDFSSETRQEYYRARNALIASLKYHIRENPYGQSLGCSGRLYPNQVTEGTSPSGYLADYVDVVPRGLILRLVKPEVADHLKILRSAATYNDLSSARGSIQGVRNSMKLTRQELIILGMTHREILEAEIEFIDDETGK